MESKKKFGFTLVELIVSFAVLSILLGAVAVLLPSFLNQYNHVQSTSRTQTIGNTLMELIEGQLSYATSSINLNTVDNNGFTIVEYDDQDGNAVYMSVLTDDFKTKYGSENKLSNNLFILRYAEASDSGDAGLVNRQAIDWGYTDDFYLNNKVTAFTVSKAPSEYRENILEVSFTLTNSKNGMENKFTRLVECTNFASTTNNDITIDGADPNPPDIPDDTEKFPNTDIVIQTNVWPVRENYDKDNPGWANVTIKPSGIFKWKDGNYYIICKEYSLNFQEWMTDPGGMALNYFVTEKLTGNIVEFNNPYDDSEQLVGLQRGDLCKIGNDYYVFNDGGDKGYSPLNSNPDYSNKWYKIPK